MQMNNVVPLSINDAVAVVPLTKGYRAIIDADDWGHIQDFRWSTVGPVASGQIYAATYLPGGECVYLHRFLMGASRKVLVDHKDNNGLNCRRSNLRLATQSNNQANRHKRLRASGIKGVHWNKAAKKFCAQIRSGGKRHYLGLFETELEAARAYDTAAVRLNGGYANINAM